MHPMIGKTFKGTIDGEVRTYEIIKVDTELGWIQLQRHGQKGFFYLHEDIHRHFLAKIGYVRRRNEKK
jgi:hypothetical protein